ncbi:MAG: helix-turn-helix transcriptional regulator [Coriobacteriales bacterium]|jgi:DNA-binding CsgD family transcriptional regulator|nr:helix-turn-helix transcriptional regulator [Coriobacteriales bacterium]
MPSGIDGKFGGAIVEAQKVLLPIFGSAMFCAWGFAWALNRAVLPAGAAGADSAYLSSTIAYVIAALVLLRRFVNGGATLTRRGVFIFTALASAATLAEILVPHLLHDDWGYFVAMVCIGLINGVCLLCLTLVWGTRFVISGRKASITIVLSFLLAFIINIVFELLPYPSSAILVVIFPIASTFMWHIDAVNRQRQANNACSVEDDKGGNSGEIFIGDVSPALLPWRTISVLSIVGFLASFFSSSASFATLQASPQAISFLTAIVLCLIYVALLAQRGPWPGIKSAYLLLIPVATLALLLIVLLGGELFVLSCGVLAGSAYLLQVVIWIQLAQTSVKEGLSPFIAFGVGGLLVTVLQIAGNLAGRALQLMGQWVASDEFMGVFALIAVLILSTSTGFLIYGGDTEEAQLEVGDEDSLAEGVAEDQDFEGAIERFACRHGLSKREQEVFAYFVRGRNIPYIAERLYVTSGTVKSHSTHIFQKAQVTSRQQLLDLFESERDSVS